MPAKPKPALIPGQTYHILNRGNNRRIIFQSTEEYAQFLQLVKKYISKIGYLHAYALMDNHFHLVIEVIPADELDTSFAKSPAKITRSIGHLQNAYAKWYNFRHTTVSGLFERSFERYHLSDDGYYRNCIRYLHFNPIKHGVAYDLSSYDWTSYQILTSELPDESNLLARDRVLARFGGLDKFKQFHQAGRGGFELAEFLEI